LIPFHGADGADALQAPGRHGVHSLVAMMDILLRYAEFATVDCGSCLAAEKFL
jgi:hypothetical protein